MVVATPGTREVCKIQIPHKIKFKMETAKYTLYPVRGQFQNNRENG